MNCKHCRAPIRRCGEGPGCTVRCIHDHPDLKIGQQPGLLQVSGPKLACLGWVHESGDQDGWHLCDPSVSHIFLAAPIPEMAAA
jgi:hypothetical protein